MINDFVKLNNVALVVRICSCKWSSIIELFLALPVWGIPFFKFNIHIGKIGMKWNV